MNQLPVFTIELTEGQKVIVKTAASNEDQIVITCVKAIMEPYSCPCCGHELYYAIAAKICGTCNWSESRGGVEGHAESD